MKKVLFIASSGGHLNELMQLEKMFKNYDSYLVTEKSKSTLFLKDKYTNKVHYLIFGTRYHPFTYFFKLIYNNIKSLFIYIKIRPKYIVTTGAHTAGPMCLIGKIFGSKIIFIESFANSSSKSITGKIVYKFADLFIVQWENMLNIYPKSVYGGWIY